MLSRCQRLAVGGVRQALRSCRPNVTVPLRVPGRFSSVLASVTPENDVLDVLPCMHVEGLGNGERVTFQLSTRDGEDMEFSSFAYYVASPEGTVSNMTDFSVGGRYQGVFPAGLQSSMMTTPEVYSDKPILKYKRLGKTNVEIPLKYTLTVLPGHLTEEELYSERRLPKPLATTTFSRTFMAPGVRRIPLEGREIEGTLFLPAEPGPHPAVVDIFGTDGGLIEHRAAMLASRGFASLGLAFMDYKNLPRRPASLPLEYFDGAINYLTDHEECQKDSVGILGSSKGSDMAIILASRRKEVKAIVTINGASVVFNIGFTSNGEEIFPTYRKDFRSIKKTPDGMFQFLIPEDSLSPEHSLSLPVENIPDDCEALLVTSDRDGFLAYKAGMALLERSRAHGKSNVYNLCLPGAGHVLDLPYLAHVPLLPMRVPNLQDNVKIPPVFLMGGNYYDTTRGIETFWRYTLNLFSKKLIHEPKMKKLQEAYNI
ncbi:acyl-coenzyme A thioesterase 1-like [Oratosquilla oratoria]|uniref:acyl-coenzyme A thioesterase 1-like n=1 Tax=Oratosquilla oratoria TaxID=337810 RepID=UPI003F77671E